MSIANIYPLLLAEYFSFAAHFASFHILSIATCGDRLTTYCKS